MLFTAGASTTNIPQYPKIMPVVMPVAAMQWPVLDENALPTNIVTPTVEKPAGLDQRHQIALGMIETGNNDREIGGAGEVSRYQIMPAVWQHYSDSRAYRDPAVSLEVAREHWAALRSSFERQAHREPTDFDMYVLWNTRQGYYSSRNFEPARLGPTVRDRAQRYVNLVEYGEFAEN